MKDNSESPVSRRDWFRLNKSSANSPATSHDSLGDKAAPDLKPVSTPEQSHEPTLNDLPPIHEAMISARQIRELFTDIEHHGSEVRLMMRGGAPTNQSADALQAACEKILDGSVVKLQIRYTRQQKNWVDTIERKSNAAFRLVRM